MTDQNKSSQSGKFYLTDKECAEVTGLSRSFFQRARVHGNGPPFLKPNGPKGRVLYRRDELLYWLERDRFNCTANFMIE